MAAAAEAVTRDQELWACALAIEREHGEAAFLHASFKIDAFDAAGEQAAAGIWREVLSRIERLEASRAARRQ